jgi:uncharacterized protein HemY
MANVAITVKNEPGDIPLAITTLHQQFGNSRISESVRDQADDLLHQLSEYIDSIPTKYATNKRNNTRQRLYETSDPVIQELERLGKYVKDKKQFTETIAFLKDTIQEKEKQSFLTEIGRLFGGVRRKRKTRRRRRAHD